MNCITVAGNLTKDSELRYLPNGDPVANFSIADNQGKDKPAIFWNCQLFGKRAESLSQYLVSGSAVSVSGNIQEREWTDKEGNKRKQFDLRVNDVALQGGKKDSSPPPAKKPAAKPQQQQTTDFDDEQIPF